MLNLFETVGLMPHGYCLLWKTWLVALHASSDLIIFASYFVIPLAIVRFLRARPDVEFGSIGALFAAFILLCGMTHLFAFATLWFPIYEVQGAVKAVTAVVSATTAAILFPLVPKLVALPSPAELERTNARLQAEIERHRATLAELEAVRAGLEEMVETRTRELTDANQRLTVVSRETVHRAKNLLTVVQSIVRQSAGFARGKDELVEALTGRMGSLGQALSTIIDSGTGNADLGQIVETQLAHYRDAYPGRIEVDGPPMPIRAEAAQQIGLAMHELATNAVKHGALSGGHGTVRVGWQRRQVDGAEVVRLSWQESGGTGGAEAVDGSGFGSLLLNRAVPMQLHAEVEAGVTADGYRYRLDVPACELAPRRNGPDEDGFAPALA